MSTKKPSPEAVKRAPKELWINWYESEGGKLGSFHETTRAEAKRTTAGQPAKQLRYVLADPKPNPNPKRKARK